MNNNYGNNINQNNNQYSQNGMYTQPYNQGNVPINNYNNYLNKQKSSSGFKILILFLVVVLVGLLIFNFKSDKKAGPHENPDYERTIMIYMVGANLESEIGLATLDLNGIDYKTMEAQNTKVLLIAGGTTSWNNNYIDVNSSSIYELTDSGYKKVKNQEKKNMGEASVLSSFLNYGYDNYKAKKYDLLFWNHGLGVLGSEHDELSDDFLSLAEIKKALSDSNFSSKNKLELVIFRTCLNGTIEVADTLKEYSNYMVASQEVTIGYQGNSLLKVLNNVSKDDDAVKFGSKFVSGYMDYMNYYISANHLYSGSVYSTYSLIDLSKIDELENSLGEFFDDINITNDYNQISRIRSTLKQYGDEVSYYDSIDLYSLINNIKSLSPSKAQKVLDNLNKVIVYNAASDSNSKGLSIYFPYRGENDFKTAIITKYYDFSGLSKYKNFITSFNNIQTKGNTGLSFVDNKVNICGSSKTEADFSLEITDDQKSKFAHAGYIVFKDNKDGTYLPVYSSNDAQLEGNTLKANIKGRQLKVTDTSDKSSNIITLSEKENTDKYIKYETYAVLENMEASDIRKWVFQSAKVELVLNKSTNKISLGSVFIRPENIRNNKESKKDLSDLPYNVTVNINDYTDIAFGSSSYKILDKKGNYITNWDSNGVFKGLEVKPKNLSFELQEYNGNTDYYAVFKIWDVNNKTTFSKLIKMK